MPNTRENLFAPQLMPMGAITYAIACSHCKNRGADAKRCNQCKCEVKSWFELDTATVQKWIPVSERLPDADGNYLVAKKIFNNSIMQEVLSFAKDGRKVDKYDFHRGWKNVWYLYDSEWGHLTIDTVTHWMPLPEPPKE